MLSSLSCIGNKENITLTVKITWNCRNCSDVYVYDCVYVCIPLNTHTHLYIYKHSFETPGKMKMHKAAWKLGLPFLPLNPTWLRLHWLAENSLPMLVLEICVPYFVYTGACQAALGGKGKVHSTLQERRLWARFLVYPPNWRLLCTAAPGADSDSLSTPELLMTPWTLTD